MKKLIVKVPILEVVWFTIIVMGISVNFLNMKWILFIGLSGIITMLYFIYIELIENYKKKVIKNEE